MPESGIVDEIIGDIGDVSVDFRSNWSLLCIDRKTEKSRVHRIPIRALRSPALLRVAFGPLS